MMFGCICLFFMYVFFMDKILSISPWLEWGGTTEEKAAADPRYRKRLPRCVQDVLDGLGLEEGRALAIYKATTVYLVKLGLAGLLLSALGWLFLLSFSDDQLSPELRKAVTTALLVPAAAMAAAFFLYRRHRDRLIAHQALRCLKFKACLLILDDDETEAELTLITPARLLPPE